MGALVDVVDDVGLSVSRTRFRNLLAGAGTLFAVAIVVFSTAVSTTSAVEVASTFDRLAATSVELVSGQPDTDPIRGPWVDLRRIASLPGAVRAGVRWRLGRVSVEPGAGPWVIERRDVEVTAVDNEATGILGLTTDGGTFTPVDHAVARPVALVGVVAAREFASPIVPGMTVMLDGVRFEVVGIVRKAKRAGNALVEILVPSSTASEIWPTRTPSASVVIEVDVGGASVIAAEAPLIVNADHPERVVALYDPEAGRLRATVTTQVDATAALVGVGLLITGAFGIAGSMVAAVSERRHEIGVRRALGGQRSHVVSLILGEAVLIGTLASLSGLLAGLSAFLAIALERHWAPVLGPEVLVAVPSVAIITCLLAGIVPAAYASRMQPVDALRS